MKAGPIQQIVYGVQLRGDFCLIDVVKLPDDSNIILKPSAMAADNISRLIEHHREVVDSILKP